MTWYDLGPYLIIAWLTARSITQQRALIRLTRVATKRLEANRVAIKLLSEVFQLSDQRQSELVLAVRMQGEGLTRMTAMILDDRARTERQRCS